MNGLDNYEIRIIGSGNIAYHLYQAAHKAAIAITQIINLHSSQKKDWVPKSLYNHKVESSKSINCIYFLAVKDDAIGSLAIQPKADDIVLHCSGSVDIAVLKKYGCNYGVFYPLQTFKVNVAVDYSKIPVFIEAETQLVHSLLHHLAIKLFSDNVIELNSEKRKKLHLAAVITNNFVYHLLSETRSYVEKNELKMSYLDALLERTLYLALEDTNDQTTGPAKRNDIQTIEYHLQLLKEDSAVLYQLYHNLTQSIRNKYANGEN